MFLVKHFFRLATIVTITEKLSFSFFMTTIVPETNSIKPCSLSKQIIPEKFSQTDKVYSRKIVANVVSCALLLRSQALAIR